MKHTKTLIAFVLLFMIIGFATITTSLSINADMELLGDLDDFVIYYSRAVVNGEEDSSIIVSSTELDFGAALKEVGTPYVIEYDITNASPSFDAEIEMTCFGSTEYFEISNIFDTSTPLGARQTRTGTLTLKKIKTLAGDAINSTISCTVVATPVERSSEATGTVPLPLENKYLVGQEVSIGTDKFNVISDNGDTISMLAQYNLTRDNLQTPVQDVFAFNFSASWEYIDDYEIDISLLDGETTELLNSYIYFLQNELEDTTIFGNLITLKQLEDLGCVISDDYSYTTAENCNESSNSSWLLTGQNWWTISAESTGGQIWYVDENGDLRPSYEEEGKGVRPVITISKATLNTLKSIEMYEIGQEVSIGEDTFNVIKDNGNSLVLLSQYSIDRGLQSSDITSYSFSDYPGWDIPYEPVDIDIKAYDTEVYANIALYETYLENIIESSDLDVDLISLNQLGALGCIISSSYSTGYNESCDNSPYSSWLVAEYWWWTKSVRADFANTLWVVSGEDGSLSPSSMIGWCVYGEDAEDLTGCLDGILIGNIFDDKNAIRPVVTVPKEYVSAQ